MLGQPFDGQASCRSAEARQIAFGAEGEQLVAEIHEHAVVAGGVVGEGGLELGGHERWVTGGVEQVIETGEQFVARGVVEDQAPADATAEGEQLGSAEALGQTGVAGEDDAEQLLGIELFAGQDPELVEDRC
jgi:hypothetical protein